MRNPLVFDSRFRVTIVAGDGVFITSDQSGTNVVSGAIYERVARLLDGCRSSYDIAVTLEPEFNLEMVYYALLQLQQRGWLHERGDPLESPEVVSVADLTALIPAFGPRAARARLVVADEYLAPELEELNRQALSERRSWMVGKISGEQIWLGPVFVPGETACWECLAQRHRTLYPVDAYLDQRRHLATVVSRPAIAPRTSLGRLAERLQATNHLGSGVMIRFDVAGGDISFEIVDRRPQCPACGDPNLYRRQLERPDFSRSWSSSRQPSAVAATISRLNSESEELIHVYTAAPAAIYDASDVATLSGALRFRCVGSGVTPADGMTAVIGETIERYSGTAHGDEPRLRTSLESLASSGVHPNTCMLFSDAQYVSRDEINARGEPTTMVPEPFDPTAPVDWTQAWSLTRDQPRFLPTAFLYRGARDAAGARMCVADSNGCAAGKTIRDSIVRGFLELVERDSIALWWYRRLPSPELNLASLQSRYCRELRRAYRAMGRELWLLDITTDLGIPAVVAVSCRMDGSAGREITFGFGAHFDGERAAVHAATELNQLVASLGATGDAERSRSPALDEWLATATVDDNPYVLPSGTCDVRHSRDVDDAAEDVERCREIVETHGLEFLVLDQTRADVALPVAKVIVPGLRPAVARFAPGRLYSPDPRSADTLGGAGERDLNPVPFFL